MKILMICERFPPDIGGLATSGFRIASCLSELGNDVHVVAWTRQHAPGTVNSTDVNGVTLHRMGRFSNWDLTMQHSLNFLDWLNERIKFDIVWGHYLQVAGFLAVMFGRKAKIKSIVSARGNDVDQMMFPPGDFARLKWVLETADFVTSVSAELSEKIKMIIGGGRQIHVIPNAVDPNIFYPEDPDPEIRKSLGVNDEELLVGFSGELRHKKGLAFFPNALAEVRSKLSASILVIGEIRARERSSLSAFAAEDPETAERFLSTGHVEEPAEVAKYLRVCDVVVQPSVWDGMPNSVLEAMACECLVLASDAGGIPEIIEHEKNGIIIPKTELNHLGEAIVETISLDKNIKDSIKRSARCTVLENFSPQNEANCLGELLNLFSAQNS